MAGLLGIPAVVLTGMFVGMSASFMLVVELPSDSPLARAMMSTRLRRILFSSAITTMIGYFINPLTGIIAECFIYPAFCIKSHSVKKQLNKICDDMKVGESKIITFQGVEHMVSKQERPKMKQNVWNDFKSWFKNKPKIQSTSMAI